MPQKQLLKQTLLTLPISEVIEDLVKLSEYQFGLTCEKAIEGAPLSVIKKIDQEFYARTMYQLFALLSDSINVANKFSMSAIPMYLQAIFSRYYYLTVDEVAYVFKKGILGDYEKKYNKLDLETLMKWFEIYDTTERMDWIEKRNHNDKIKQEKELKETISKVDPIMINEIIQSLCGDPEQEERDYQEYKKKILSDIKNKDEPDN